MADEEEARKAVIDISGIDKAELLAALHNATHPLGLGCLQDIGHMTVEKAREILGTLVLSWQGPEPVKYRFDYVFGRPVKVTFKGDQLINAWLYDRDAFPGACAEVVRVLKERLPKEG